MQSIAWKDFFEMSYYVSSGTDVKPYIHSLILRCNTVSVENETVIISSWSQTLSPSPPLDNIRVMVIVWRLRGNIIRTVVCWIVWHNVHSLQHTYMSSSYRSNRLGLSHWDPYAVHRGSCLELYCCNMVEWFRWDSSLISTTNWFPSVLWHCWFGHLASGDRPWGDLLCVEWYVKPYTLTHSQTVYGTELHSVVVFTNIFTVLQCVPTSQVIVCCLLYSCRQFWQRAHNVGDTVVIKVEADSHWKGY